MRYEQTGTSVEFLAEWISTVPEKGGGTELQSSDPCGTELQSSDWVLHSPSLQYVGRSAEAIAPFGIRKSVTSPLDPTTYRPLE